MLLQLSFNILKNIQIAYNIFWASNCLILLYVIVAKVSKNFWNKTIGEFTNGKFEIIKDNPEAIYEDGTIGHVLLFELFG